MRARLALVVLVLIATPLQAAAQTPLQSARTLLTRYSEDTRRLDRARDLLEEDLRHDAQVPALVLLSRVNFLYGDVRALTDEEKLAAYRRGRELGKRAVELAPRDEDAHLWYALNTGRWGQTKGVMRSLFLVPELKRELEIIFQLNPRSVGGHILAGNVLAELPALLGGDRKKAEEHFHKALEIDPKFTAARVDLARLLIAQERQTEARRELHRVTEETAPTNPADWAARDLPRARKLLDALKEKT
jgi:tetratricopeptide (TPR) repeat protein